jgi:hypothetical protein
MVTSEILDFGARMTSPSTADATTDPVIGSER